ncbi:MAG: hypothetical protein AAF602_23715 [Myxococcota bacterium]
MFVRTLLLAAGLVACTGETDPVDGEEMEVITTLTLIFTPQSGGADLEFVATDPMNTGDLTVDPIELSDAEDYDLAVTFFNDLEDEDITEEIEEEDDEHQVFFTGSGVVGPASDSMDAVVTHAYGDTDGGGLPIGLANSVVTDAEGTGDFTVTLRHLPPENDVVVKVAGLEDIVAMEGFGGIPGENDIQVTFDLTVAP